jgi:hypothetical protein
MSHHRKNNIPASSYRFPATSSAAAPQPPLPSQYQYSQTIDIARLEDLLEDEKEASRFESWNKIDGVLKLQKLETYAESYGRNQNLAADEVQSLKTFFQECLAKKKLQKAKDVIYDKSTGVVQNVPALYIHGASRQYSLKNLDKTRVSTIRSLAPKRILHSHVTSPGEQEQEYHHVGGGGGGEGTGV